jgi:hypothetical protein
MAENKLKEKVLKLYDKGLTLNQILDHLVKEDKLDVTFMDVRLAVSEIEDERNLYTNEPEPEEVVEDEEPEIEEVPEVLIEMNAILQPGAPLQGKAKFKSGRAMKFMMDQSGRIGIEPIGAEQPDQMELQIFQQELIRQLKAGMV